MFYQLFRSVNWGYAENKILAGTVSIRNNVVCVLLTLLFYSNWIDYRMELAFS